MALTVSPGTTAGPTSLLPVLMARGVRLISVPVEVESAAIVPLAAGVPGVEPEVSVLGRPAFAISACCHHARAHGLHRDGCRYLRGEAPDGVAAETLEGSRLWPDSDDMVAVAETPPVP